MPFCPNLSNPVVKKEFNKLVKTHGENLAYFLWDKYEGNIPKNLGAQKTNTTKWFKDRFGANSVFFKSSMENIPNGEVLGYVQGAAAYLKENPPFDLKYHEGFHLFFRTTLNDAQRNDLYNEYRKTVGVPNQETINKLRELYPDATAAELESLGIEEGMAEMFREYAVLEEAPKTLSQKIAKFFKDLLAYIKAMVTKKVTMKRAFRLLESGKIPVTFRRTVNNFGDQKAYMIKEYAQSVELYTELLDVAIKNIIDKYDRALKDTTGTKKQVKAVGERLFTELMGDENLGRESDVRLDFLRLSISDAEGVQIPYSKLLEYHELLKANDIEALDSFIETNDYYPVPPVKTLSGAELSKVFYEDTGLDSDSEYTRLENLAKDFKRVYQYWYDVTLPNGKTQVGFRSEILTALPDFGIRVSKRTIKEVDPTNAFEDDSQEAERIYDVNRLEENPQKKLTKQQKVLLSRIPVDSNVKSFTGLPRYVSSSEVYKTILQLTADKRDFADMLNEIEVKSESIPFLTHVHEFILGLTAPEQAAFFSVFNMSYHNFVSVDVEQDGTGQIVNKIYSPNLAGVQKAVELQWRSRSILPGSILSKKTNDVGNIIGFEISQDRVALIDKLRKEVGFTDDAKLFSAVLDAQKQASLAKLLLAMGFQIADTESEAINRVQKSIKGRTSKEKISVAKLLTTTQFPNILKRFLAGGTLSENPFETEKSTLASFINAFVVPYEVSKAQSFVNNLSKSIYPINLKARLNDDAVGIKNGDLLEAISKSVQHKAGNKTSILYKLLGSNKFSINHSFQDSDALTHITETTELTEAGYQMTLANRLILFANNGNNPYMVLDTQGDRSKITSGFFPKLETIDQERDFGIQIKDIKKLFEEDMMLELNRMYEAWVDIEQAVRSNNYSQLIEGYHYRLDGETRDFSKGGWVKFGMLDTFSLPVDRMGLPKSENGANFFKLLNDVSFAINNDITLSPESSPIFNSLLERLEQEFLENEEELLNSISTDPEQREIFVRRYLPSKVIGNPDEFLRKYSRYDRVSRYVYRAMFMDGVNFAKNPAEVIKRYQLITTPGYKGIIKGDLPADPNYGLSKTFNASTIRDVFTSLPENDKQRFVAAISTKYGQSAAKNIMKAFDRTQSTDAFSMITVKHAVELLEFRGKTNEDINKAYAEYKRTGEWNAETPFVALKPSYNGRVNVTMKDEAGKDRYTLSVPFFDKTAYIVLDRGLVKGIPVMEDILDRMELKGRYADNPNLPRIDVLQTESTQKLAKLPTHNLSTDTVEDLSNMVVREMDSRYLRFPEDTPEKREKSEILQGKQIRVNAVANIPNDGIYTYNSGLSGRETNVSGRDLKRIFQSALVQKIEKSSKAVYDSLGYTAVLEANTEAERAAALKVFRRTLREELLELAGEDAQKFPQAVLDALEINQETGEAVLPFAHASLQGKFDQLLFSIFKNKIYKQKNPGVQMVQFPDIAPRKLKEEDESLALKFLNIEGNRIAHAEVDISADMLINMGIPEDIINEAIKTGDLSKIDDSLKRVIAYRIPQQGKSSMMIMKIRKLLPKSHDGIIRVPSGITTLMGSDFDIDKLFVMFPTVETETEETTEGLTDVTGKNADIERRQELANLITSKLELGIELPKILETLAEQGYVEKINNSAFFKQTTDRDAVVFNIDGAIVPMYRSSKGTSSKIKGKWYPFFFNAGDWLVKGGADSYKDGYNNPIIKQILDALNTNYTYDTPIATVEGDNNQILSLLGLEDLDVSFENNDGIFDYRNYGAIALVLEDWQSKLGNIDVTGYQKYLDGVSSNLIAVNPTLKSEIQSAFDGISNLFAELAAQEGAAQPTTEAKPKETKKPKVYKKISIAYDELINNPNAIKNLSMAQLNTIVFDTFEAVGSSLNNVHELVSPLDAEDLTVLVQNSMYKTENMKINGTKDSIQSFVDNQLAAKLVGAYANAITARNILMASEIDPSLLTHTSEQYPTDQYTFIDTEFLRDAEGNVIGETVKSVTSDRLVEYAHFEDILGAKRPTDSPMSLHLSAALDAVKNFGIHAAINDTRHTASMYTYLYSKGLSPRQADAIMNHPIIRSISKSGGSIASGIKDIMTYFSDTLGTNTYKELLNAASFENTSVIDFRNLRKHAELVGNVNNQNLSIIDIRDIIEEEYPGEFFKTLMTFSRLNTRANDLNNLYSALMILNIDKSGTTAQNLELMDLINYYLYNDKLGSIYGNKNIITELFVGDAYPSLKATYQAIKNNLQLASDGGFLVNQPAMKKFRDAIAGLNYGNPLGENIQKLVLNAVRLYMSTHKESNLAKSGLLNKSVVQQLFFEPKNNIITMHAKVKELLLREGISNPFVESLTPFQRPGGIYQKDLFYLRYDNTLYKETNSVNAIHAGWNALYFNVAEYFTDRAEIDFLKSFAQYAVLNTIVTTGMAPGPKSNASVMPPEILADLGAAEDVYKMLNTLNSDPSYLVENFFHDFVRGYLANITKGLQTFASINSLGKSDSSIVETGTRVSTSKALPIYFKLFINIGKGIRSGLFTYNIIGVDPNDSKSTIIELVEVPTINIPQVFYESFIIDDLGGGEFEHKSMISPTLPIAGTPIYANDAPFPGGITDAMFEERFERDFNPYGLETRDDIAPDGSPTQDLNSLFADPEVFSTTTTRVTPVINIYWGSPESATNTRVLSNLAPRKFIYQGKVYGSVEHAYQSNKSGTFDQTTYDAYNNLKEIPGKQGPGYGTKIKGKAVQKEFDNLQLMRDLVVESFRQNPEQAKLLLNYGDFTHSTNEVIDKAFLDGIRLAQKNVQVQNFQDGPVGPTAADFSPQEDNTEGPRIDLFSRKLDRERMVRDMPKTLTQKINRLKKSFLAAGINVDIVLETLPDGVKGMVRGGVVYLDPDQVTTDTAYHELGHILIDMLPKEDVDRYIEEIKALSPELYEEVKNAYPELNERELGIEALVTAIGMEGAKIETKSPSLIRRLINKILRALGRLFGIRQNAAEMLAEKMFAGDLKSLRLNKELNDQIRLSKAFGRTIDRIYQDATETLERRLTQLKFSKETPDTEKERLRVVQMQNTLKTMSETKNTLDGFLSFNEFILTQTADIENAFNDIEAARNNKITKEDALVLLNKASKIRDLLGIVYNANRSKSITDQIITILEDQVSTLGDDQKDAGQQILANLNRALIKMSGFEARFIDNVVPLVADVYVEYQDTELDNQIQEIVDAITANRDTTLNSFEIRDPAIKTLISKKPKDKTSPEYAQWEDDVIQAKIEYLKNKKSGREGIIKELTSSYRDKSLFSLWLDPLVYSNEANLQMFAIAFKEQDRQANRESLKDLAEAERQYKKFKAYKGDDTNKSKFYGDLLTKVKITVADSELEVLSLVQPFDRDRYYNNMKAMYDRISVGKPDPSDDAAYKAWKQSPAYVIYRQERADWWKANSVKVPDAEIKYNDLMDAIANKTTEVAVQNGLGNAAAAALIETELKELRIKAASVYDAGYDVWMGELAMPNRSYENPQYSKIQSTPELKEFYDYLLKLYNKGQKIYGKSTSQFKNAWDDISYIAPSVRTSTIQSLLDRGVKGVATEWFENVTTASTDQEIYGAAFDQNDNPIKFLPRYFINPVEEKLVSKDILSSILMYNHKAYQYEGKSKLTGLVNAMTNIYEHREIIKTDDSGRGMLNREAEKVKKMFADKYTGNLGVTVSGDRSNALNHLMQFIDVAYYGIIKKPMEEKILGMDPNKLAGTLNSLSSMGNLAFNVLQVGNQAILDSSTTFTEGVAAEYFSKNDVVWAQGTFAASGGGIRDLGQFAPVTKLGKAVMYFDALTNVSDNVGRGASSNKFLKLMSTDNLFALQGAVEYQTASVRMLAMMKATEGNFKDSSGNVIMNEKGEPANLWDVIIETEDGIAYDPKVDMSKSSFNETAFNNRLAGLTKRTNQVKGTLDASTIGRTPLGSLFMLYKQYFIPNWRKRFGHGEEYHIDHELGSITRGAYYSLASFLKLTRKAYSNGGSIGEVYAGLSKVDKKNLRRVAMDAMYIMAAKVIYAICKSILDEDDDDENYHVAFMAYQARRLQTELLAYTPVIGIGETIRLAKSPLAATGRLEKMWDFSKHLLTIEVPYSAQTVVGLQPSESLIEDAIYQRDSYWGEKGERKSMGKLKKVLPVINGASTLDKAAVEDKLRFFETL